jgi:hypothetical protein
MGITFRASSAIVIVVTFGTIIATGFQDKYSTGNGSPPPSFDKFLVPAPELFKGNPASPHLKTPGQRRFRTMIRQTAAKGANFAGHFALAEWGCGTACVQAAIVDVQSGEVYDGPFGLLPGSAFYFGTGDDEVEVGMSYHLDSRLLIAAGCPNFQKCGTYFYEWIGSEFKLLRRVPMKQLPGAEK